VLKLRRFIRLPHTQSWEGVGAPAAWSIDEHGPESDSLL
jgi:hypothetical protein